MALGNITLRSTGTAVTNLRSNVNANISGTITLKNAPMTHSEVDMNFLEIAEDVAGLQNATVSFASLTGKPTTIAGYGITDAFDNTAFDTRLASKDTGDLAEGSNLYYTDARADARATLRITAASITNLGDVDAVVAGDDGKVLYYDHSTASFKWKVDSATPSGYNNTNWDTAYGWGNHASAGYLTSFTETFTSLVDDTTPQLGGTLDANSNEIDMGTNVITDAKVGQWDTAYTWGDHGSAGYLTAISGQSIGALSDVTITSASSNQILKYNGSAWVNQDINLNAEEDFDIRTADFNADLSTRYGIDTTSNSVTVTLPASPGTGRAIMFAQAGGDFSVNNFIINPNGKNINGSSGNYTQSTNLDFASIGVFYNGTEWRKYG